MAEIEAEDTFVLSYLLTPFQHSHLWLDNRPTPWAPVAAGQLHVYDLAERIRADIREPLEFLYMYLPRLSLDDFAHEHDIPRVGVNLFRSGSALEDSIFAGLADVILSLISLGAAADQLLLDQLVVRLQMQFLHRFAQGGRSSTYRGGMAPWQERCAKSLLDASLTGAITVGRLASECGLSRGHFLQAFRRTTGLTPHQWLMARRVERAKVLLLRSPLPLAEIARRCGFAHQSHFTRVFHRRTGAPPGEWRRANAALALLASPQPADLAFSSKVRKSAGSPLCASAGARPCSR